MAIGCTEAWSLKSKTGRAYEVNIGFPRDWDKHHLIEGQKIPIMYAILSMQCLESDGIYGALSSQDYSYLTDGNSVFLTALEVLHRRLSVFPATVALIVSIGYPLPADSASVFDPRRRWDLTPPASGCDQAEGGADELINFIDDMVRKLAHRRLRETRGVEPGKEALFGHSLGGLFCLHTLFTNTKLFDCYIASSPSVWWNDEYLLQEEALFRERRDDDANYFYLHKPSLIISAGNQEQEPPRNRNETDEEYERRWRQYHERKMVDHVHGVYKRLRKSHKLNHMSSMIYEGQDHGTVVSCSLSRGLTTFIEDWPLEE